MMEGNTMDESSVVQSHRATGGTTKVELATLLLPASAHDGGVQAGDGSEFILVGESAETVADSRASAEDPSLNAHIEGVIDLDVLSGLVSGVTDEEFVEILHHDAAAAAAAAEPPRPPPQEPKESLLSVPHAAEEETPLVQERRGRAPSIALSADPFVETLATSLPPAPVAAAAAAADHGAQPTTVTHVETTTNEDHDRLAHEAFLLSIPAAEAAPPSGGDVVADGGGAPEKLVLALPEIQATGEEMEIHRDHHHHHTFPELVHRFSTLPTLPTDVQHVELHATTTIRPSLVAGIPAREEIHLDVVVERKVPLVGYVILIAGLFALASVGAALDLQTGGVSPAMKCLWRLNATSAALFPLAAKSCRRWREDLAKLTRKEVVVLFPVCACSYAIMTTTFIVALEMTSLANAFILSNLASLVIILSKAARGLPILLLEGTGAAIGLFGALICADASSSRETYSSPPTALQDERMLASVVTGGFLTREMMGNFIAFLASVGTAMYLVIAKDLRNKVDLFVFMFFLFTGASIFLLVYMLFVSEENLSFSVDPVYGVFGWMTPVADRLPLELYMAIVCNIVGTTGYVAVMKYFDPVVVSMVMLTEPVIAAFISVLAGVDSLPGLQVWIGDVIVTAGSVMVIYSGSQKTESFDATESLLTPKIKKIPAVPKSPLIMKSPSLQKDKDGWAGFFRGSSKPTRSVSCPGGSKVIWD